MRFQIRPITQGDALSIANWHYPFPYSLYNLSPDRLPALLDHELRYHAVFDEDEMLVGYCCFGDDARVPGGDYRSGEPDVLDVGLGLRPDLTGKGLGGGFIAAVLDFAAESLAPTRFRVTVVYHNRRSVRAFENAGFRVTRRFIRKNNGMPFVQLEREVETA